MKQIPYGRHFIEEDDIRAVTNALRSEFLTNGPCIEEFEKAFAQYIGAPHAVAVSNGTAALHLAAMALDVKPGQKVITSPITFSASANCVRYCGGDVAFADIDPDTFLLDVKAVRRLLEKNPPGTFHGIVPVDFGGLPVDLEEFRNLADEFNLWILEDACHAPGGAFRNSAGKLSRCGDASYADMAIFSFHPVKHIASGEGGMVTCRSGVLAERVRLLRTHGISRKEDLLPEGHMGWYYEMQELGFNYRLTDFQAALGLSQLKKADARLARRREIARRYDEAFSGKIRAQHVGSRQDHAFHLYVILTENRDELFKKLRERGIFAQVHYIPVHLMPYYKRMGWRQGDFPRSEYYYQRCLSLPMFPSLTDEEQQYVIDAVLEIAR